MTVAVADIHEPSAIAVASEIQGRGERGFPIRVDVTSPSSLADAARAVVERTGAVHVLCNNAGVMVAPGPSADLLPADWDYVFSVNVFGVVQGVQAFLPILLRSVPDAHIVNTASLGGLFVVDGASLGVYLASKYACVGYTECLREELASRGIGVSVLCPGMVESNLPHTSARNRPSRFGVQPDPIQHRETEQAIDEMTRDRRTLTPEQVGAIVVRGIRENRLHIVTHPEALELVERRFASIVADFAFAERSAGATRP
jgi:NAD(P)-dependent dehydrogenase (short-subunit alcohol dehydrogenase family)